MTRRVVLSDPPKKRVLFEDAPVRRVPPAQVVEGLGAKPVDGDSVPEALARALDESMDDLMHGRIVELDLQKMRAELERVQAASRRVRRRFPPR